MATPYITNDVLKARLVACLQRAGLTDSDSNWDLIVADANEWAYNEIVSALLERGFTISQINEWDRREEFNKSLGLFWCLVLGGVTHAYDDKFIRDLDRREELKTVFVSTGQEPVDPETENRISTGMLENDADVFTMDSEI